MLPHKKHSLRAITNIVATPFVLLADIKTYNSPTTEFIFWTLKKSSHEYKKKDANTVEFYVNVAKDQEAVLDYTVAYERR